jgi:hypothetical protein
LLGKPSLTNVGTLAILPPEHPICGNALPPVVSPIELNLFAAALLTTKKIFECRFTSVSCTRARTISAMARARDSSSGTSGLSVR